MAISKIMRTDLEKERDQDNVYLLYPGRVEDEGWEPVAAFSKREVAESLAKALCQYVEDGACVKPIKGSSTDLLVDRFENLVKIGMKPYSVSLHRDGFLFEPMDILARDLEEPTVETEYEFVKQMREAELTDPGKEWGVGGTFWAPDSELALKKAKVLRKMIFKLLDIPLKIGKEKQPGIVKKYSYEAIVDLTRWFEDKYIGRSLDQEGHKQIFTQEQIKNHLDLLLIESRQTGESSVNYPVYSQLQLIRHLYS